MEIEVNLQISNQIAGDREVYQRTKQEMSDQYCTTKISSTETNDIESDCGISQCISPIGSEEFLKIKSESQEKLKDPQSKTAYIMLQKRRHVQLDQITEMEDVSSSVISDSDVQQSYEFQRKMIKVSSQFNAYLDKNIYCDQTTSYAPIAQSTPEAEEQKKSFATNFNKNFNSEKMSKIFSSSKDINLVQTDVPERFQLLLNNFVAGKQINEDVMKHLVRWIYSNLSQKDGTNKIKLETVENVVRLVVQQKMEVMTIWNNESNFIPNISIQTLWDIFNLMINYKDEIYFPRSRNEEVVIEMYSIRQISDIIQFFMNVAQNSKEFNDIQQHLNYLKCCFEIQARKVSDLLQSHLTKINQAREYNIPQIIYQYFDDSSCCAEMLFPKITDLAPYKEEYEAKFNPIRQQASQKLINQMEIYNEENLLSHIYQNYTQLSQQERLNLSELIQDYICIDFLYNPIIKKFIIDNYMKYAVLSTSPQAHVIGFNIYHEFFAAKKIIKKPLSEITSNEFLTILQASQQNLIECKILLPWQIDQGEDLIYREISQHFQPHLASKSESLNSYTQNLLQRLLKNYLYPYAQQQVYKHLENKSLTEVRDICVSKFKEYISYGPYLIRDRQDQLVKPETILSFYVHESSGIVGVSMISQDGKEIHKNCLEYYFNADKLVSQKREQEIKNLYEFIRNRQPYVIIVSSNCSRALVLKSNLYIQFKNLCRNILMCEQTLMTCYLNQSSFIQSPKDKYIFLARKQAKAFQFRLLEVCSLWNYESNPLLEIKLHPFQKKVDKKELQIRFEQVIQERICQDGLEFKTLFDKNLSFKDCLQFIPGFGPRKSHFFISQFEQGKDFKEITSRKKCIQLNLMGENLIVNCMAFMMFSKSDNLLDQTKIPYNQYFIVNHIVETIDKCQLLDQTPQQTAVQSGDMVNFQGQLQKMISKPEVWMNNFDINDYSKLLEKNYQRPNMVIVLSKILEKLCALSNLNEKMKMIPPELSLKQIFESIYNIHPNCIRKGAQLMLKFRDITEKYIEFTSKDFKIRCRLMKSDIPNGLAVEKFYQKKRNAEIELILDSTKVFENQNENTHQIDAIFDNKVTFTYPDYKALATQIVTEFKDKNPYFGQLDQTDLPSTRVDLKSQFNIFSKEMEKNPHNVIDLTESTPSFQMQQQCKQIQESSSSSWANSSGSSTVQSNQTWASNDSNQGWNNSNQAQNEQSLRQKDNSQSEFKKPFNKNNNQNDFSAGDNSSSSWGTSQTKPSWESKQSESNNFNDQPLRSRNQQQQNSNFKNDNNSFGNKEQSSGWNQSNNNNNSDTSGWGNSSNDSGQNASKEDGWGSSNNKTNSNEGGGWGQNMNKSSDNDWSKQDNSSSWGGAQNNKAPTNNLAKSSSNEGGGWGNNSSSSSSNNWGASKDQTSTNESGGNGWNSSQNNDNSGWGTSNTSSSSNFGQNSGRERNQNGGNKGKGCFKCGKVGHMAKDCTEPQQQGRKQSGACFKCNQEGHMSKDCPNQQQKKSGCFKCGEEGHFSKDCPNPQKQQQQKPRGGACFKCGEEGHISKDCPNPQKQQQKNTCFKCKQEGHISKDCPNSQNSGGNKCFNCNQEGHMSKDCPNPSQKKKGCFNCGEEGHQSRECTKERKERPPRNNNNNNNGNFRGNKQFGGGGNSNGGQSWGTSSGSDWNCQSNVQESTTTSSGGWGSSGSGNQTGGGWGSNDNQQQQNENTGGGGWGSSNSNQTNNESSWGSNNQASSGENQNNQWGNGGGSGGW
ncbi:CnjB protein (macronuclear) [Tetrahymena thermophila SB210]|uniref:CnjB protein n=1 Tax=Tetrahymena thermophila (strain SB210) TaxID=312017 RepID=Q24BQ3_TETTS|nr:CnjB protein [Tetrahymena thermophila SB210]EAS05190.2 CnjB protein [Tetrahymena thermophila SB210]|eukprot:XP_001025435.2 CnjB protein [Tetrahymena thermophila SB210]